MTTTITIENINAFAEKVLGGMAVQDVINDCVRSFLNRLQEESELIRDDVYDAIMDAWDRQENQEELVDKTVAAWQQESVQDALVALMEEHKVKRGAPAKPHAKKLKDPNAPKRPKNGYMFFCDDHREEAKANIGGDAKAIEIVRDLGVMWKALQESKKAADKKAYEKYQKMAEDAKAAYEEKMKVYERPSDEELLKLNINKPKVKNVKNPNAPKHPKNVYMFFCADHREKAKIECGADAKAPDVAKKLGAMWAELQKSKKSADKKAYEKYQKMAEDDKARYNAEKAAHKPDDDIPKKDDKVPSPKKKTAYALYCEDHREAAKKKLGGDAKARDVQKKLSEMWKDLDKDVKKSYEEKAKDQ